MKHLTTKAMMSVANRPSIDLVAAAYCDGMRVREKCARCGRRQIRISPGQLIECSCGFFNKTVGDYYVEPGFIEIDPLVYEQDFAPLIAPLHLVSDLVVLRFHTLHEGQQWSDLCDGCKFISHELAALSKAIPRDPIRLHFLAGQIYWGTDRRTVNDNPHKFACEGSPP
jgi:hypothetical protein